MCIKQQWHTVVLGEHLPRQAGGAGHSWMADSYSTWAGQC